MKWLFEKLAAIIAIFTAGYERRRREEAEDDAKYANDALRIANERPLDRAAIIDKLHKGEL